MLVRDYMTRRVVTLAPETEVLKALMVLADNDISGAPVLNAGGKVVGMLTEKDCLKSALEATYHSEFGGLVSDYMNADVASVEPDDGVVKVAERFVAHSYHRYPVLEDGVLVGIISRRDVIQALAGAWQWT